MAVQIVTDSTADISAELAQELGIAVVPLNVHFGNEVFRDGVDMTPDAFFARLAQSKQLPTTSQPSAGSFGDAYRPLAGPEGILSIHISSKLSGTLNSAAIAAEELKDRVRIELVDSTLVSLGLGLIVIAAAKAASEGKSLDYLAQMARDLTSKVHIIFMIETLEFLQRGGRIGRARALIGSLLQLRPILLLEDGEIRPFERVRTRRKGLERLKEYAFSFPAAAEVGIMHSTSPADAQELAETISERIPRDRILVGNLGPVVGVHAGPGVVGLVVREP